MVIATSSSVCYDTSYLQNKKVTLASVQDRTKGIGFTQALKQPKLKIDNM